MEITKNLRIFELYASGMSPGDIAKRLDVPRADVCRLTGHVHPEPTDEAKEEWSNRITGGVVGLD